MEWIVVKTLLSLAGVLLLMIGVVYALKKILGAGRMSSSSVVEMKLIGTMMLQPKRSVLLLKVMNKVLILGLTEEGVQTLGEITDEGSLREIEAKLATGRSGVSPVAGAAPSGPAFARILAAHFARLTARGAH